MEFKPDQSELRKLLEDMEAKMQAPRIPLPPAGRCIYSKIIQFDNELLQECLKESMGDDPKPDVIIEGDE